MQCGHRGGAVGWFRLGGRRHCVAHLHVRLVVDKQLSELDSFRKSAAAVRSQGRGCWMVSTR
jgi:hypothetical protein